MSGPAPDLPFVPKSALERIFDGFGWRDTADILMVAFIVTYLLQVIRDSRAMQMLRGLALLVVAMVIARHFSLHTMAWLVNALLVLWAIALIIVLQPELRRVIVSLGESSILRTIFPQSPASFHEIAAAARLLAAQGWGGLVVVERETSLAGFAESGVRVDADVKAELMAAIFTPGSPLHDGGVIVREGRIYAAACTLPLSEIRTQAQSLGMRHRAA